MESPDFINFPIEEFLDPVEPPNLPERICSIEVVAIDPSRSNPKISLAHTLTEFKATVILLPDDSTVLTYIPNPRDISEGPITQFEVTAEHSSSYEERGFPPGVAFVLAQDLCLSWLGLDATKESLNWKPNFFTDRQSRRLLFDEPETENSLYEEEEVVRALSAHKRIEGVSSSAPASFFIPHYF